MQIAAVKPIFAGLAATLMLLACSKPAAPAGSTASALGSAPAVAVSTARAQQRDVPVTVLSTGVVTALTSVEVRPQVTSTVVGLHFAEGQFVKAGQLLFTLDARSDAANVAKAQAQMVKDQASLADVTRQLERAHQLFAQHFVSQGAVDTAQAQLESMAALVNADLAALQASQVTHSYNRVSAALSGRAGLVNVAAGSAVLANQTPLVTITQLDPIGVTFSLPQRQLALALKALQSGTAVVRVTLADGGGSFTGRLQFVDNLIDVSSGTFKAKAIFANPDYKLWPGAFVDVAQTVATLKDAVVIAQEAIIETSKGSQVYLVQQGKALLRPVKLIYAEAGEAAVSGLKAGDRVVLDGKQNVRPNAKVVERDKASKAPARAASAAR